MRIHILIIIKIIKGFSLESVRDKVATIRWTSNNPWRLAFGECGAGHGSASQVISLAAINFRHDFTQLTIGRVGSHFWVVFFDRRRDFRRLNGNK